MKAALSLSLQFLVYPDTTKIDFIASFGSSRRQKGLDSDQLLKAWSNDSVILLTKLKWLDLSENDYKVIVSAKN